MFFLRSSVAGAMLESSPRRSEIPQCWRLLYLIGSRRYVDKVIPMEAGTENGSLPCSLCYLGPLSACAGNSRPQVVAAEPKAPEIDPLCRTLHTWLGKTGFKALIFKYNPKFLPRVYGSQRDFWVLEDGCLRPAPPLHNTLSGFSPCWF